MIHAFVRFRYAGAAGQKKTCVCPRLRAAGQKAIIIKLKHTAVSALAVFLLLVAVLTAACSGREKESTICVLSSDSESGLPLPAVPDSLISPDARAAHAAVHFWDALPSVAPSLRADTAFMEQSFSNFIAILPYVTEAVRDTAVVRLVRSVRPLQSDYVLLAEIARKYLDDPNSPMRSEELFITFLRHFAADPALPEAMRLRAADRLASAMKNRPGCVASDFRLLTRDGRRSTLRREVAADTTIVMFYDPECTHCREITARLISLGPSLRYRVLAVDAVPGREAWDAAKDALPAAWTVAYAIDPIDDDEIYYLPALPSFYLLAPDATVLLKDFSL